MSETAYHHGNLKQTLLDAAATALEKVGYEDLSLRSLAGDAGVSRGAPYRHFPSREALLVGLAIDGAQILERSYRTAIDVDAPAVVRLRRVCEAYLDLAAVRPQLFRLMFVSDVIIGDTADPDWIRAVQPGYDLYEGAVAAAYPQLDAAGVRAQAAFCWATIHGLALLRMHGRLQRFTTRGEGEKVLVRTTLDRLLGSRST